MLLLVSMSTREIPTALVFVCGGGPDVTNRLVGRHDVRATVTRRKENGTELQECMVVPVVIEDSNECTLPERHPMHHE